jgi:hypothetical protein
METDLEDAQDGAEQTWATKASAVTRTLDSLAQHHLTCSRNSNGVLQSVDSGPRGCLQPHLSLQRLKPVCGYLSNKKSGTGSVDEHGRNFKSITSTAMGTPASHGRG